MNASDEKNTRNRSVIETKTPYKYPGTNCGNKRKRNTCNASSEEGEVERLSARIAKSARR